MALAGAAILLALAFSTPPASAQDSGPPTRHTRGSEQALDVLKQVATWEKRLETFEKQLAEGALETEQELRTALDKLRGTVTDIADAETKLEQQLETVTQQLQALGATPPKAKEGEGVEGEQGQEGEEAGPAALPDDQQLKQTVQGLQERSDRLEGGLKRLSLLKTRIEQVQDRILAELRERVKSRLLSKNPSPVLPGTLAAAGAESAELVTVVVQSFVRAVENLEADMRALLAGALAGLVLAVLLARTGWLSRFLLQRIAPRHAGPDTCHSITVQILLRVALPAGMAYGAGVVLVDHLFTLGEAHILSDAAARAFWRYVTAFGLLHVVLQTGHGGEGNLIRLPPDLACRLFFGVNLLLIGNYLIYGIFLFDKTTPVPDSMASVVGGAIAVVVGITLGYLAHRALPRPAPADDEDANDQAEAGGASDPAPEPAADDASDADEPLSGEEDEHGAAYRAGMIAAQIARLLLFLVVLCVLGAAVLGYTTMALQVLRSLLAIGVFAAFLSLVHAFVVRLSRHLASTGFARDLRRNAPLPRNFRSAAAGWLHTIFVLALIVYGIVGSLVLAGVPRDVVRERATQLFTGVRIGDLEISLTDVFVGVAVFMIVVVLTRWMQTLVASRLFKKSQLDIGIQNSISTFIGYAGFALAAVLAIGSFGLDLSNLAVIAGALSVGIGFGLQAIVNNFVSGIILLVERPIKIGDWIELNGQHGTVKRINVRSTEIETFNRQSIIVPNSELISRSVTNYTHKNTQGRIDIKIGVEHGTDLKKLQDVLLEVARSVRHVQRNPAPYVFFGSIGDTALHVELRAYLRDINWYIDAVTELNSKVYDALQENGIEIAYPQRTLHIPQLGDVWRKDDAEALPEARPKSKRETVAADAAPKGGGQDAGPD